MRNALQLNKVRVRGLGHVVESDWVDIAQRVTYFSLPRDFNRSGFLQALQTVNPPYDCEQQLPFKDYPHITRQGKYQKRVRPQRRTIGFSIFNGLPDLVRSLSTITPDLYETDRIEVGRRFDYSRWINFVEIASSSRWSEVSDEVNALIDAFPATMPEELALTVDSLISSDRVKDKLRNDLVGWLDGLNHIDIDDPVRERLADLRFILERQRYFDEAKEEVASRLPLFFIVDADTVAKFSAKQATSFSLDNIIGCIDSYIASEKNSSRSRPVFLIDAVTFNLDGRRSQSLMSYIRDISREYQCLYLLEKGDQFVSGDWDKTVQLDAILQEKLAH